jgi:hypothetical protein
LNLHVSMKKTICLIIALSFLAISGKLYAQELPQMRYADKLRIKEAINIADHYGNKIWTGMNETPFVVLLVMDSVEFLFNHPYPSADFKLSEEDKILSAKIFYRKRQYSKSFLATFPAVNGVNCIVVGTPENTGKNSTDWIITLLHEHFHQYQYIRKDHYASVAALDLSGGDQTGMWQLNYPLPYDSEPVFTQYTKYANALSKAVASVDTKDFKTLLNEFITERKELIGLFTSADYRYFSFQLWQEGIARYTEYKFLQLLDDYTVATEVSQMTDFVPFRKFKEEFLKLHLSSVTALKFEKEKRICFYDIGLAEGILLDKLNPQWRSQYFNKRFFLENYAAELK